MNPKRLLLDTCAVFWITEDEPLSREATVAINVASAEGVPIAISPITGWERANLMNKGKLTSPRTAKEWFDEFTARPEIEVTPLNADILISSAGLPEPLHRDPADRIIIATARAFDLTVVTRDRLILDYATKGHVRALPC